jgi:hypothetical protein
LTAPPDADRGIVPADSDLVGWTIEFVALAENVRRFREDQKTVCEPASYPHPATVLVTQFSGNVLPECGAAVPDVDRLVYSVAVGQHSSAFALDFQ